MNILESRFIPKRWSTTRRAIAALEPGELVILPLKERNNAVTTCSRLRDAYPERSYSSIGASMNPRPKLKHTRLWIIRDE